MTGLTLDPQTYYRIFNDAVGVNATLSDGYSAESTNPRTVFVSETSFSSENWQLLSQNGIWFIRGMSLLGTNESTAKNFDHGRDYQLGTDGTSVQLLDSTTKLNQQWTIEQGSNSALFSFQNLAGNSQQFLGLSSNNLPVMTTGTSGVWWRIEPNDAGAIPDDMLEQYTSIEQLPAFTTSSIRTASTAGITTSANANSATDVLARETLTSVSNGVTVTIFTADASLQAAATSTSPSSNSQQSLNNTPNTVSPGAIAGGVIGGLAGLAIIAALLFFLCVRRKRQRLSSGSTTRDIAAYNDQAALQQREKNMPQTPSSYSSPPPAQHWGAGAGAAASYYQDDVNAWKSLGGASSYAVSPDTYAPPVPAPPPPHGPVVHEMDGSKGARESYVELPAGR